MITSYELTLQPSRAVPRRDELAYCLYAALLASLPSVVGEAQHQNGLSPLSQSVRYTEDGRLLWRVNLLTEAAERCFSGALETLQLYETSHDGLQLRVDGLRRSRVESVEALTEAALRGGKLKTLRFETPTAFRSGGQYLILPELALLLGSLIRRWNVCYPDYLIVDETGEGFSELTEGLRCEAFRAESGFFRLKGNRIPGFTGELCLRNRLEGFPGEVLDTLLQFAGYAGVGVKTTLGMGGVRLLTETEIKQEKREKLGRNGKQSGHSEV